MLNQKNATKYVIAIMLDEDATGIVTQSLIITNINRYILTMRIRKKISRVISN